MNSTKALWIGRALLLVAGACSNGEKNAEIPNGGASTMQDAGAEDGRSSPGIPDATGRVDGGGDLLDSGRADASLADASDASNTSTSPGLAVDQTILVRGVSRTYDVYVPPLAPGEKAPIVFLFHGNGGSAQQLLGLDGKKAPFKRWLDLAKTKKLVVFAPQGLQGSSGQAGWNDCRADATTNPTSDDVAFADALLDLAIAKLGGDPTRAFATGISNGGNLSLRLAIERTSRFVAVAPVAAALAADSECAAPTSPIGLLLLNGTADPIRPDNGGAMFGTGRGTVLSSTATVAAFRTANGISQPTVETPLPSLSATDGCTVARVASPTARAQDVVHLRIDGGGHTDPSLVERYSNLFLTTVGRQNGDIEMADVVWAFFETQHR
jgi:polyhydroxybutyrate depolymerase